MRCSTSLYVKLCVQITKLLINFIIIEICTRFYYFLRIYIYNIYMYICTYYMCIGAYIKGMKRKGVAVFVSLERLGETHSNVERPLYTSEWACIVFESLCARLLCRSISWSVNVLLPKNMQSTVALVEVDKLENPTSIGTEIIASSNSWIFGFCHEKCIGLNLMHFDKSLNTIF